jgi:hypothetical protein
MTYTFGVSVDGLPTDLTQLKEFEALVGKPVSIANFYIDFTTPTFDDVTPTAMINAGLEVMLTWQPTDWSTTHPITLAEIIAGKYDNLITTWAQQIARWGKPLYMRFAHEMNGNWYSWCVGVNGNTANQYVQAWHHVHNLFETAKATNVKWIWCPNVLWGQGPSLAACYPGDGWCWLVGVDGYNWGTVDGNTWESPSSIFDESLADLRTVTKKNILICETSCVEQGGSKAAWISTFFAWLSTTPQLTGFLWFNINNNPNWLVNSSASSLAAFKKGLVD